MAIPTPAPYIAEFEKLGFGMFVHWGLYSQLNRGEWIREREQIPSEEYEKLFHTFTAEDFDAKALTGLAKQAGMKYIVLTTRHHEGFSLYDTMGLNEFDAPHSPAKRDLVREFVDACREDGIVPFFYHTTLDWHHPDFRTDFPKYQQYLRDSVKILCTRYGKIGGLWFDGNWSRPEADWEEDALYDMIRSYQPEAMIINNSGIHARGAKGNCQLDSVTFENGRAEPMDREGMEKYIAAEMCLTMNDHWGCAGDDFDYKSSAQLIRDLCACRKVGANFLLNIGPTAQGGFHPMQKALLEILGRWTALFSEAVYDVKPTAIRSENNAEDFGVIAPDGTVYLYVHSLAIDGGANVTVYEGGHCKRTYNAVPVGAKSAQWLDSGEVLPFRQEGGKLTVGFTPFPYGRQTVVRVAKLTF